MREKISGYGLATVFILLSITLLLAERSPPILLGLAIILAGISADWRRLAEIPYWRLPVIVLGALCAWMLVTSIWAVGGLESFTRGLRVSLTLMLCAATVLAALTLQGEARRLATKGAWIACGILFALIVFEIIFDAPLLRLLRYELHGELYVADNVPEIAEPGITYALNHHLYNRMSYAAVALSVLAFPVAAALWRMDRRPFAVAAVLVALAFLSQVPMAAALISLIVACGAASYAMWGSRLAARILAGVSAFGVMLMPVMARTAHDVFVAGNASLPMSWAHRIGIWNYVSRLIAEKPVFGWGMESARIFSRNEEALTDLQPRFGDIFFQAMPLHPHNGSLQIWFELGGIGALIYACFIGTMIFTIWRAAHDTAARIACTGAFFAALAVAHLSFGVWQYWWLSTLGLLGAIIVLLHRRETA